MPDERLIPLRKGGQPVELAMTEHDFFTRKLLRKGDAPIDSMRTADMETYAEAGYSLSDRYEDLEPYTGPQTQRQYDQQRAERRGERAASAAPKAAAKADESKEATTTVHVEAKKE